MKAAEDVMSAPVLVQAHDPVAGLAAALERANADGACVMEQGRLVGVVTTMDLVDPEDRHARRVVDIMSVHPVTVLPGATVRHCAERMVRDHLTILPVVDHTGLLLGVVTKDTVLGVAGLAHHVIKES